MCVYLCVFYIFVCIYVYMCNLYIYLYTGTDAGDNEAYPLGVLSVNKLLLEYTIYNTYSIVFSLGIFSPIHG